MKIKRVIAGILAAATVVTTIAWPTATSDAVKAEAALGSVVNVGNTHYVIDINGNDLYTATVENGNLYIRSGKF